MWSVGPDASLTHHVLGPCRFNFVSCRAVVALSCLTRPAGLAHVEKLLEDCGLWRLARWVADAVASSGEQLQMDVDAHALSKPSASSRALVPFHTPTAATDFRRIYLDAALRLRRIFGQLSALGRAVTKMKCG